MAEGNGNGFELQAGPATLKASGSTVIPVLLALLVIGVSFYGVFTTNQQTMQIQTEHAQHLAVISTEHRQMTEMLRDLTQANELVFLSTILSPEQKKDLPEYLKLRVKQIVERKAETITESR